MHGQRRYIIVFLTVAFLSALYLVTDFESVPDADATGGAFKDTKHGGGTVDGFPHSGVDRSVNPDHFPFYSSSTDAGQYNPAECVHCHEPHNLFGGVSQDPESSPQDSSAGTPDPYLLFGDNTNELCWYCHENINFDPFYGGGVGALRFYQGQLIFEGSSHGDSATTTFRWPGDTDLTNDGTIWPREYARPSGDANKCINCHTPHGIRDTTNSPGHDFGTPASTDREVGADPTSGSTELIPRQLIAREEALCLNCHDGTPAADINTHINKRITDSDPASSSASGHAVRNTYALHDLINEESADRVAGWNTTNWHVECTDCHNPHVASKGPNDSTKAYVFQMSGGSETINTNRNSGGSSDLSLEPVRIGNANKGVWGVSVTNAGGIYNVTYAAKDEVEFVYELCLKCHSTFGDATGKVSPSTTRGISNDGMPNSQNFTNVGEEFDPDNCSGAPTGNYLNGAIHPVLGQGCNQPAAGTNTIASGAANDAWCSGCAGTRTDGAPFDMSQNLVPPWEADSYVTCVDCHLADGDPDPATKATGPHGSANYFILRSVDTNISYDRDDGAGGTTTYSYSGISDSANLCINCHRADIYGWFNVTSSTFDYFARQTHPTDGNAPGSGGGQQSFTASDPPRGIVCLRCHGGRIIGGIHGINTTDSKGNDGATVFGSHAGRAFLYGESWNGYDMGTGPGGTQPDCSVVATVGGWDTCGHHGSSVSDQGESNYKWPMP
jgi:hypothetical protein